MEAVLSGTTENRAHKGMVTQGNLKLATKLYSNENYGFKCINEPPRGKTNNVVSKQVRHKPTCTSTEAGEKVEILELGRGGILLSE